MPLYTAPAFSLVGQRFDQCVAKTLCGLAMWEIKVPFTCFWEASSACWSASPNTPSHDGRALEDCQLRLQRSLQRVQSIWSVRQTENSPAQLEWRARPPVNVGCCICKRRSQELEPLLQPGDPAFLPGFEFERGEIPGTERQLGLTTELHELVLYKDACTVAGVHDPHSCHA